MAKPELGLKRTCVACSGKFYDLTRAPAVCPKCGTEQPVEQPRMRRAGPNPLDAQLSATAYSCQLDSTSRSCTVSGAAGFSAGDALELVWTNSATVAEQTPPGPIGIAFSCQ